MNETRLAQIRAARERKDERRRIRAAVQDARPHPPAQACGCKNVRYEVRNLKTGEVVASFARESDAHAALEQTS